MFDREEFRQRLRDEATKRVQSQKPLWYQLMAVAPKMETLTQSDEWNRYLGYLQNRIEQAKEIQVSADLLLHNPKVTEPEDLLRAKIDYLMALAREQALTEAQAIPRQIINAGKSAEEMIGKLDNN